MNSVNRIIYLFIILLISANASAQYTDKQADSLLNELYNRSFSSRDEAMKCCVDLETFFENSGDTCKRIQVIAKQAYFELGSAQFKQSLSSLIKAQKLYEISSCEINTRIQVLLSFSDLYEGLNDFEKADSVALLGIQLFDHSNPDKTDLIKLYMSAHSAANSLDIGLPYLDTAYNLAVESNNPYLQQKILMSIGVLYANNDNYKEASKYMQRAVPLAKKRNALATVSALYNNLAGLSDNDEKTLMYVDSALHYAYEDDNLADIQLYTENKAYFYSTLGDYKNGYQQLWKSMLLKDSLLNIKKIEAIAEMEHKYEAEKKSNEIQSLKLEKLNTELENINYKRTQNGLLIGSIFLLMLAAFFAYNFLSARKNRDKLAKKNVEIDKARQLSDELLLNILPSEIALELKEKGSAEARKFDKVSILFTDFKEFTQTSEKLSATELVSKINYCFKGFDEIMEKYGIEKIKTIGDAYMAAGGLPVLTEESVKNTVMAGLEMQDFISKRKQELESDGEIAFEMRVGIHTGPVVAGIVGVKKFQYDLWGDTVNTASRMETNGKVAMVNISGDTYEIIKNDPLFAFESRGKIEVKGKGEIDMYFVSLINKA